MIQVKTTRSKEPPCPCDDCARKRARRRKAVRQGGLAGVIASAVALATPFIHQWEGTRNVTYLDLGGVPTACTGHTGPDAGPLGRVWSDAQCDALLRADIDKHLAPIVACVPALAGRPDQLAAATSLAFNIGAARFCQSTAARKFRAGDWLGGCDAFLLWVKVDGRTIRGLERRRRAERDLCRVNLTLPSQRA